MEKPLSEIARSIEPGPDGIWRTCAAARQVSFPDDGNRLCFAVEDDSFWFEHRKRCLLALLEHFPAPGAFFDVGGGNGHLAAALQARGHEVVLIEPGPEGARNARRRGIRNVICGRLEDAGFESGTLPAIGLFDVLEHIEDDRGFLNLCARLQPTGGRLYLTVPAFASLWSSEDEIAGHFRRYRRPQLAHLIEAAGYKVEFASYLFEFLLIPVLLGRALPYRLGPRRRTESEADVRADHVAQGWLRRALLRVFTNRELARLKRLRSLRAGTSILLVAQRCC